MLTRFFFGPWVAALSITLALCACSPSLNWREVPDQDAGYSVLFPAKPSTATRSVNLDGLKVELRMSAAEVDTMNFAVASARIADPTQRDQALEAMQTAMLKNIASSQFSKKPIRLKNGATAIEVVASGQAAQRPLVLHARFVASGDRVYQAIALGPREQLSDEVAETFLTSFAPN
jgi:hypothetical protein